jgi:hypothetical protein
VLTFWCLFAKKEKDKMWQQLYIMLLAIYLAFFFPPYQKLLSSTCSFFFFFWILQELNHDGNAEATLYFDAYDIYKDLGRLRCSDESSEYANESNGVE